MDSTLNRQPAAPSFRAPLSQSPTPASPTSPTAAPMPAPAAAVPAAAAPAAAPSNRNMIGRVLAVSGAHVTVGLSAANPAADSSKATVGKFLGTLSTNSVIVGMITEIAERPDKEQDNGCRSVARLDLVGEIKSKGPGTTAHFQRGVTEYPIIGEPAMLMTERELRVIYGGGETQTSPIGVLQQDHTIPAQIDIENLVSKHFAVLGTTGVGKSNGVAIILQKILEEQPDLRIFLIDPHNEYGRCFDDKSQVLTPRNLRLPFWLFNFEETIDAFFGGRPGVEEEVEILSEVIPLAKAVYGQYKGNANDRQLAKRKDPRSSGFGVDTPVPYRIEDLTALIDERMGKLENRSRTAIYNKLLQRIQTFRNHPRYGFMFENATVGGDTMVEVLSHLFRIPANGKPMTIMQLAGFPAEVVDSVVSVLSRMAFDFGLWSDGASPLLFVCEEAHRYAPADSKIGFGPTRRALSRIAKEGRKYGVFLGLVTQRPAEIDPTIISQCSTLFVMRLSNDRDQVLIRSAVSDAAANLLTFIPSLGTAEVFAFGAGVALPTRMKFRELPVHLRPTSEAGGNTRIAAGMSPDRNLIASVIERWRSSTMTQKHAFDDDTGELGSWRDEGAATVSSPPPAPPPPSYQPPPRPTAEPNRLEPNRLGMDNSRLGAGVEPNRLGLDPQRPSILRKPLNSEPTPPQSAPTRWR
jgi:DNA helicase HerA-like ATPase